MNTKTGKIIKYLPIPLIALFLWVYYLCNVKLGVYAQDDILYSTNLVTGKALSNVADIIEGQIWHYFNWGGRSIAHTILQLTFLAGDTFINILNPIACLAFAFVCNLFVKKRSLWTFLAFLSGIFALNPIWYETELWQTGIANYMYLAIFYLPLLYLYMKETEEPTEKYRAALIPAAAVLGLIAGWSNENVGPALFVGFVLCMVILRLKKRKLPAWMIVGAACTFIGCVVMILAPGNYVRADEAAAQGDVSGLMMIAGRFYMLLMALFVYAGFALAYLVGAFVLSKGFAGSKWRWKDTVIMLIAVLTIGAMVMSPHYPHRAIFATVALFLIAGTMWISEAEEKISPVLCRVGITILWAAGIFRMLMFYIE